MTGVLTFRCHDCGQRWRHWAPAQRHEHPRIELVGIFGRSVAMGDVVTHMARERAAVLRARKRPKS